MRRRTFWAWVILCVEISFAWGIWADESQPQPPLPLPKPIGAINDYAAALGRESREQLQALIAELRSERKVAVTILITLLDPYSDPRRLSEALWEEWKLGPERTIFLLLVREADRWRFHWKASPDLAAQLSDPMGEYHRSIQGLLEERRVGRAALQAVEYLTELLGGPKGVGPEPRFEPEDRSLRPFLGSPPFWYLLGGVAGMGVLWVLIRMVRVRLCPECGRRLSRRSAQAFGPSYARLARRGARDWVYYCQRCGYLRIRRGER
jgi:hypothetical protein